ncbi:MAG TPA: glycosyltransferase family 2 protein [Candidatus Phocaeicola merdavium]|nr:glycosyltransferase family 2 protein [Candidatus Phocaeicola merdavium]
MTFIHYENSGVSTARNRGIYHAKGEYIWFIDPDDYITPNALSIIFKQLEDNPDLLLFNFNILFEKNNSTTTIKNFLTNSSEVKIINDKQLIRDYIPYIIGYSQDNINRMYKGMKIQTKNGFMHGAVWHYIFKREIINKENIWFSGDCI